MVFQLMDNPLEKFGKLTHYEYTPPAGWLVHTISHFAAGCCGFSPAGKHPGDKYPIGVFARSLDMGGAG